LREFEGPHHHQEFKINLLGKVVVLSSKQRLGRTGYNRVQGGFDIVLAELEVEAEMSTLTETRRKSGCKSRGWRTRS
jgi:hypothetical protein